MALRKEQIISISKEENIKQIKCLDLSSMNLHSGFKLLLELLGTRLFILSLKSNNFPDINISLGFTNLRKLDLSTNLISNVGPPELWESMPSLKVLYLHDNLINSWDDLKSLSQMPRVMHITLFNNPCIHFEGYREYLICKLPSLLALDFLIATEEERKGYFTPNLLNAKVWIQDTMDMNSFHNHIYKLKRRWEKVSPAIRIQSLWRKYLVKKHIGSYVSERDKSAILIQKHVRGWLLRNSLRKDLESLLRETNNEELLYPPEEFIEIKAARKIEEVYINVYKKTKEEKKKRNLAATKFQTMFRTWKNSRYGLPILEGTKIYVFKSQQRTFICLLKALSQLTEEYHPAYSITDRMVPEFFERKLPKENYSFSDLFSRIKTCKTLKVVRFPDLELFEYKLVPLIQMLQWIPYAKFANNHESKTLSEISVSSLYHHTEYLSYLKKLKTRGCPFTREERKKYQSLELELDDYLDLVEFEAPSKEFLQKLFMLVLAYNKTASNKDCPIFLPLFQVLVNRVNAACTIQAHWRGYRVRKSLPLIQEVLMRRAVFCIQRWWRFVKFHRRLLFLSHLHRSLKEIEEPVLYIQEHLFQNLTVTSSSLDFPEQDFDFYIQENEVFLVLGETGRLLPKWFNLDFEVSDSKFLGLSSDEEKTLQAIVLSGAFVDIKNLYSEVASKPLVSDASLKFIKLKYNTLEDARRRAAIVFLKTLDHKTNTYVPVFSKSMLEHPFLMSKLRKIWTTKKINPKKPCAATQILSKALEPVYETPITEKREPEPSKPSETFEKVPSYSGSPPPIKPYSSVSHKEVVAQRVKNARETIKKRREQIKATQKAELEAKIDQSKEEKKKLNEIKTTRENAEFREKALKRSFVKAMENKKQVIESEKTFITNFAQARNMMQSIMKKNEYARFKRKSYVETIKKVNQIKEKNKERREIVEALLYERFKTKQRQTAFL